MDGSIFRQSGEIALIRPPAQLSHYLFLNIREGHRVVGKEYDDHSEFKNSPFAVI